MKNRERSDTKLVLGTALLNSVAVCTTTYLIYRDWVRRKRLEKDLDLANEKLTFLKEKLKKLNDGEKPIRIFLDGAFDLMHFGHMNAFRLARSLGTELIVGVNSEKSIAECKGAPLMNDEERLSMVSSCKFVDQVVEDCPYIMNQEYLAWVMEKYQIDYVVHGDDPCFVNGKDAYATAKALGKFRTIPRTRGVSTTDIVGRMLLLTKEHHLTPQRPQSKFLTTSQMLQLFSADVKAATPDMKVIYTDGAWDLFHPGHVATLKAARERGDYLIVGIHSDETVNRQRGVNLPLMNLHERVLSVLGCRYVSDVLIDAPFVVTQDMVSSLNIAEVVRGNYGTSFVDTKERYGRVKNIFKEIKIDTSFRVSNVVQRIQKNQETFQARFERKMQAENEHFLAASRNEQ